MNKDQNTRPQEATKERQRDQRPNKSELDLRSKGPGTSTIVRHGEKLPVSTGVSL